MLCRSIAFSTLADLLHNLRNELSVPQLHRVVSLCVGGWASLVTRASRAERGAGFCAT
jgi:hypothetical protein